MISYEQVVILVLLREYGKLKISEVMGVASRDAHELWRVEDTTAWLEDLRNKGLVSYQMVDQVEMGGEFDTYFTGGQRAFELTECGMANAGAIVEKFLKLFGKK